MVGVAVSSRSARRRWCEKEEEAEEEIEGSMEDEDVGDLL